MTDKKDLPRRWSNIKKVLERGGPFCHPEFEPSSQLMDQIFNQCRILIIGAGGLGCELLKDLALMGFKKLDVVDMDTIELSNLNRQFLFRQKDIGRSKAECAAEFINKRIRGCQVTPHCCKLQSLDEDFFTNFNIIISGLDNIVTRRWINGLLISTLQYSEDGEVDQSSIIPLIDGGTEGFKGNARVIIPGLTACIECTLDLYPPQVNYPLCTIANTPRLPEHCIEYVKLIQWSKEDPFNGAVIDGDDPQHINWIYEKSVERANQFNISGLTYRLVQGVVKNIIPAVASTNAAIAAACATEAFKLATSCCAPFSNYMVFNNVDGIYTYTYEAEKKDDCIGCSQKSQPLEINDLEKTKLEDIIQLLKENVTYQMKSPGLTTTDINGKNKTLYMENVPSIEEATRKNLKKTLCELGLVDGSELVVNDITSPNSIFFKIRSRTMDVN